MKILADMQSTGMPQEVLIEQRKRIVSVQFAGLDVDRQRNLMQAIEEPALEQQPSGNVVPLRVDPNADLRDAVTQRLRASGGGA